MKFFLDLIVILLGLTVALMFFPALIGIFVGIMKFDSGNIFGGIIAIHTMMTSDMRRNSAIRCLEHLTNAII